MMQLSSRNLPAINDLRQLLEYDPITGTIRWKVTVHRSKRRAGDIAGGRATAGYAHITVQHRILYSHRVAWALHYGYWPITLDHINRNRLDNRICNLREATQSQNMANCT